MMRAAVHMSGGEFQRNSAVLVSRHSQNLFNQSQQMGEVIFFTAGENPAKPQRKYFSLRVHRRMKEIPPNGAEKPMILVLEH